MATLDLSGRLTLPEALKATHNGEMLAVGEILNREKPCIMHSVWVEANDMMTNVSSQRASLMTGSWRMFNAGVPSSYNKRVQQTDQIGMLRDYIITDVDLVNKMPSPEAYRLKEATAGMEGMTQTFATALFYENGKINAERWTGLAPRMSALNGKNVQGCGGTGTDLSSVYFVMWDPAEVYMTYPRGGQSWLLHRDLGESTYIDPSTGYRHQIYTDYFSWDAGLVVEDPKAIGRVANIEVTGTSNIFNEDIFISVKNHMRNQGRGAVGYCSTEVYTQAQIAVKNKGNVVFSMKDPFGTGEIPSILGIPLYVDEMIQNDETALV